MVLLQDGGGTPEDVKVCYRDGTCQRSYITPSSASEDTDRASEPAEPYHSSSSSSFQSVPDRKEDISSAVAPASEDLQSVSHRKEDITSAVAPPNPWWAANSLATRGWN